MIMHFIWTDKELVERLDHLVNDHELYIFDVTEITTLRVEDWDVKLFQIYYDEPDDECPDD